MAFETTVNPFHVTML